MKCSITCGFAALRVEKFSKRPRNALIARIDISPSHFLVLAHRSFSLFSSFQVKEYFQEADQKSQLLLLSEIGLSEAVRQYVEKEEKGAVDLIVEHQLKQTRSFLEVRLAYSQMFSVWIFA